MRAVPLPAVLVLCAALVGASCFTRALVPTSAEAARPAQAAQAVQAAQPAQAAQAVQAAQPAQATQPTQPAQAPAVAMSASFSPERLGAGTTVHLGFRIASRSGQPPSPLTELGVRYPAELGIATSNLGLETCSIARLGEDGLAGCPANSLMGHGFAVVVVPFSVGRVRERVRLTLLSRPVQDGNLGLLFFAEGEAPVIADLIFPGQVLPAPLPFGGLLDTQLPLVPSAPEGPDVAVLRMQTTIGPSDILYHRRVHGKVVAFRPRGILLPSSCPRGGFLFTVEMAFQNGSHAEASTRVKCPR